MLNIRIALIEGKEIQYDVCSESIMSENEKIKSKLDYLGKGIIFSINGTRQDIDSPEYEIEKNYTPVIPKTLYFYKNKLY